MDGQPSLNVEDGMQQANVTSADPLGLQSFRLRTFQATSFRATNRGP